MSSDSPAPSLALSRSSSVAPSAETLRSAPARKKRTIMVVRRPRDRGGPPGSSGEEEDDVSRGAPPASPKKKTLLVARRPRASEGRLFEEDAMPHRAGVGGAVAAAAAGGGGGREGGGARRGSSTGQRFSSAVAGKLQWLPDGRVVDKSVLGPAAAFEEVCTCVAGGLVYAYIYIQEWGVIFVSSLHVLRRLLRRRRRAARPRWSCIRFPLCAGFHGRTFFHRERRLKLSGGSYKSEVRLVLCLRQS